jgi:hypothetical protein
MSAQYERTLQTEVIWRSKVLPLKVVSNLNGIWLPAREAEPVRCPRCGFEFEGPGEKAIVARLINRLKTDGFIIPGVPDLTFIWQGGGGFIELKRPATRDLFGVRKPAGRATDSQKQYTEECRGLGINHGFASTWEDVRSHLRTWGAIE